jgi:hypothetical protein
VHCEWQPVGCTGFNLQKTYVDCLQHILDEGVPDGGQLASWLPMAWSRSSWELLSRDGINQRTAKMLLY